MRRQSNRKMGQITLCFLFTIAAAGYAYVGMTLHPIAYWGVLTNLAFALGYVSRKTRFWLAKLMKGPDGFTWAALFFLPSYVLIWSWWALRHYVFLRNFAPSALAYKKYYLGRYPVEGLPKGVSTVVDITAEFPKSCPTNVSYICIPSLDVTLPEASDFLDAAYAVMKLENETSGSIYVHCANGHGRSALFLILIMMLQGAIATPAEGKDILRRARPKVNWVPAQEQVLIKALALHEARGTPLLSGTDHFQSDDSP